MKMSRGKAAAEIEDRLGKFSTWTDPAAIRTVNSVVRLYAEFNDSLTSETDTAAVAAASQEYLAIRGGSRPLWGAERAPPPRGPPPPPPPPVGNPPPPPPGPPPPAGPPSPGPPPRG